MDSQENPLCHIDLLQRYINIAPHLSPPSLHSSAVLWNQDISLQNILISNDPHPKIVALLDWQNVLINPLYLGFCEPTFLQLDFMATERKSKLITTV